MNQACTFILAALVIFVQQDKCTALVPQIKMVRAQPWFVNPSYNGALSYDIQKHNETYNDIGLHWELIKDLPVDLSVRTSIYVTNSTYGDEELILEVVTKICAKDTHHDLLPKVVLKDESQLSGSCIKKGVYHMKDMGQYRYELLLPNIDQLGMYYKTDYVVGNQFETVLIVTFYSEWGYLNQ